MHPGNTVREILADTHRGASEIEERLLRVLVDELGARNEGTGAQGIEELLETLTEGVRELQPSMANLLGLVDQAWRLWEELGEQELEEQGAEGGAARRLERVWRRRLDRLADREQALGRHLVIWAGRRWEGPGLTVLTLSRSGTVRAGLMALAAAGWDPTVIVGEGRPGCEGRELARELLHPKGGGRGLEARLATDAAVVALAAGSSPVDRWAVDPSRAAVLVGADAVGPDELLNKVGTRALAAAARERDLPVLVLADRAKIVPRELFDLLELPAAPTEELDPPPGVPALSFYFERIPLDLVTEVVTEDGAAAPEEIRRLASRAVSRRLCKSPE